MAGIAARLINLSPDELSLALPLLVSSAYKPLRYLAKDSGTDLADFWYRRLLDRLQLPASRGYLALQGSTPLGLLTCSDNPWETNLLGKRAVTIDAFVLDNSCPDRQAVARSILERALQDARTDGVRFVLGKTCTDEMDGIHALESHGFLLMDTVLDCIYDYRRVAFETLPCPVLAEDVVLRPAALSDRDELVTLAGQAFQKHFGRFHADERIGPQLAMQAYEQWMHSSLDGYADWIHLALVKGKIAGFSIWKRPSLAESQLKLRLGHYSIAGIHPDYHGRGLFTALTYAGMQSLYGIADIIEGPTHVNNYGVQLGYLKLGWRVGCDSRHSFHKWID
jgi:GNAT superfamily N-acetyltransferase